MSYDFRMEADKCSQCGHPPPIDYGENDKLCGKEWHGNYTYNVAEMFKTALKGKPITKFDGRYGFELVDDFFYAIEDMKDNPKKYREMEPENGWGSYDGAIDVLKCLLGWFRELPKCKFRIS